MDALREAIEKATGETPAWKPQPGEYVIGEVVAIRDVDTDLGKSRVVELVNEDNGELVAVFMTTMLQERFQDYGIVPGERIALKYHGRKQNAKGREYHHWTVLVDRSRRRSGEADAVEIAEAYEAATVDKEEFPF